VCHRLCSSCVSVSLLGITFNRGKGQKRIVSPGPPDKNAMLDFLPCWVMLPIGELVLDLDNALILRYYEVNMISNIRNDCEGEGQRRLAMNSS
jgi:hypothetical protein